MASASFQSTPLIRGETSSCLPCRIRPWISIHSPHTRGDSARTSTAFFMRISIHSPHTRGDLFSCACFLFHTIFQSTPLTRGETFSNSSLSSARSISIHSPHTRGDSISLQKSIRIYVSLHNKTMIHRFSELYNPLFAAQSPIFGVRSPRESHDSFTFARLSEGRGITP